MALKDITLGRYIHRDSFIHRLDPRTKLSCTLMVMSGLFMGESWRALFLACAYGILAGAAAGLPVGYMIRSIMPFKWLIILTFLLNVLFTGGYIITEAPLPYGGITREGLAAGTMNGMRIGILVLISSILTLTTQPTVLVTGVEKLLAPLSKVGIKTHEIALAMVITLRFIPVFIDEAVKIGKSFRARGFNPHGSILMNVKMVSLMLVPLFSSALYRAEHLAVAMDSRLYRSSSPRTRYHETSMTGHDWLALGATIFASCLMAIV